MQSARDIPTAIAAAADGSIWFTIDFANAVGRVQDGKVIRLSKPTQNLEPVGLAVAPDGSAWYTDAPAKRVSRMTPGGELTSVTLETPIARLGGIAVAPDGAIWFAEASAYSITRLKDGQLQRHVIESPRGGPYGVAVAPDGTVWATLQTANKILRIGADGAMRGFDIPTRGSSPTDIVVDAKGVVWFLEFRGNRLGRLQDGKFEEVKLGDENVARERPGRGARRRGLVRHAARRQPGSVSRRQDRGHQAAPRARAPLWRGGGQGGQRLVLGHHRVRGDAQEVRRQA